MYIYIHKHSHLQIYICVCNNVLIHVYLLNTFIELYSNVKSKIIIIIIIVAAFIIFSIIIICKLLLILNILVCLQKCLGKLGMMALLN